MAEKLCNANIWRTAKLAHLNQVPAVRLNARSSDLPRYSSRVSEDLNYQLIPYSNLMVLQKAIQALQGLVLSSSGRIHLTRHANNHWRQVVFLPACLLTSSPSREKSVALNIKMPRYTKSCLSVWAGIVDQSADGVVCMACSHSTPMLLGQHKCRHSEDDCSHVVGGYGVREPAMRHKQCGRVHGSSSGIGGSSQAWPFTSWEIWLDYTIAFLPVCSQISAKQKWAWTGNSLSKSRMFPLRVSSNSILDILLHVSAA